MTFPIDCFIIIIIIIRDKRPESGHHVPGFSFMSIERNFLFKSKEKELITICQSASQKDHILTTLDFIQF